MTDEQRMERCIARIALLLAPDDAAVHINFDELPAQVKVLVAERDRLLAVVDHLRETATRAIAQENDDEYDQGNIDAWEYALGHIRRELDAKEGT